jgi:hypothetical protein
MGLLRIDVVVACTSPDLEAEGIARSVQARPDAVHRRTRQESGFCNHRSTNAFFRHITRTNKDGVSFFDADRTIWLNTDNRMLRLELVPPTSRLRNFKRTN